MKKQNSLLNYVIYGLIIIIGIIFLVNYLNDNSNSNKKDEIVFELKGEKNVTHNLGEPYTDAGFKLEGDNVDITTGLSIENNVNVEEEGDYTVTYKYNNLTIMRYVKVKRLNSFRLLGNENIYLVLNGKYEDENVEALNNGIDSSSEVVINNNLDTSNAGDYSITYSLDSLNKTLTRNIHVSDFNSYFKVNYDSTTKSESLTLDITIDKDKVSKYIMPDNSEKTDNDSYTIKENGTYKFIVYDKYNNQLEKNIEITNIKLPVISKCEAIAYYNKTEITVTADDNIKKYIYNGVEGNSKTYTFNNKITDNKVILYDIDNKRTELTCETTIDNSARLEIHFIASGFYDDAILIRSNNATIFIDGGRGKERVLDYLKKLNISTIDYVIGSHTEYDHIDAQGYVIRTFNVKNAIYPNNIYSCGCACEANDVRSVINGLSAKGLKARIQGVPSKLQVEDMSLHFIAPFTIGCNKNNNSFIFILQFGNNKFMFTGDADSALNNINKLQSNAQATGLADIHADIFKAPHHGNQIVGNTLMKTIGPRAIIVPNYNARQYGGPVAGVPAYRQSDSSTGNIVLISDGNDIDIKMNASPEQYAR